MGKRGADNDLNKDNASDEENSDDVSVDCEVKEARKVFELTRQAWTAGCASSSCWW